MHQSLREGGPIELFSIVGQKAKARKNFIWNNYAATVGGKNSTLLQLTPSDEYPLVEKTKLDVGHYYRPRANNFLAVNSLLLSSPNESPILLMFQMTRAKGDHGVSERGLNKIAELGLPSGTRKYYVVVTPRDRQPRITASVSHFKAGEKPGQVFPVFHYPIHEDRLFDRPN